MENSSDSTHETEKVEETNDSNSQELESLPLLEHLRELRTRIIYCLVFLVIGTCIAYSFSDVTFKILNKPYFEYFPPKSMIGINPAEAFLLKIKVAFFTGTLIFSPLLLHQIWLFIAPGLYQEERSMVIPFVLISTGLFGIGVYLCYELILPVTYQFFAAQYKSIDLSAQIRVSEHLAIAIKALLGFGLAFELPVLTYFLARFGILEYQQLWSWFKYSIVFAFIAAAILTPTPDIVTQTLFAVPLIIIYFISVGSAWLGGRATRPTPEEGADAP